MAFQNERRRMLYVKRYYESSSSGEDSLRKAKINLQDQVVKLNKLLSDLDADTSGVVSQAERDEVEATVNKFNNWIASIHAALNN